MEIAQVKYGFMKRTWNFLKTPSAKYSVLAIGVVTLITGAILSTSFSAALEATNKLDFCIGCHEMRDTVYQEYKKTIHYSNRIAKASTASRSSAARRPQWKAAMFIGTASPLRAIACSMASAESGSAPS